MTLKYDASQCVVNWWDIEVVLIRHRTGLGCPQGLALGTGQIAGLNTSSVLYIHYKELCEINM